MNPFVSLCLIVKNEEKVVRRCLDSVVDIVDEIIVVDSGSTDKTKEIAQEYTSNIYDYEWNDSFGDARNFAQSKANGKWILVLDADEYVDRVNLVEVIEKLKMEESSTEAYEVRIYNFTGFNGEKIIQHKSIRIYKNRPEIHYFRSIHEQLAKKDGELQVGSSNLILYHSGYLNRTVREKDKGSRNTALLEKEIGASGKSGFDYFNLGNEYLGKGDNEKALENYLNAYKSKPDFRYSWVSFCIIQIISCLINLKRYKDALAVINDAEMIYSQSPDFKCLKGYVYFLQHRLEDAKFELQDLLNKKFQYQVAITSIDYMEFYPYKLLGEIYNQEGNYQEAINSYSKALKVNYKSSETLMELMKIAFRFVQPDEIYDFVKKQEIIKDQQDLKNLIKVIINIPGSLSLIDRYVNEVQEKQVVQGIQIKILLLKKEYEQTFNKLCSLSIDGLRKVISEGFFDFNDFLILCLILNKQNFLFSVAKIFNNTESFINFVFGLEINAPKQAHYLLLLERCINLGEFDLFESLLSKRLSYDKEINLNIGHLLFKYGFKDLAISFYQEVDIKSYDIETFVNVIMEFEQIKEFDDALNFVFKALENYNDFRLYKTGIKLLHQKNAFDMKLRLQKNAFQLYPDSYWLKSDFHF